MDFSWFGKKACINENKFFNPTTSFANDSHNKNPSIYQLIFLIKASKISKNISTSVLSKSLSAKPYVSNIV